MKRSLVWLVPMMLLAGCAQLDDAKEAAADAQAKLDEAKREAQEAKERLDRVRSSTIVRAEILRIVVVPMSHNDTIWFDTAAWRGETAVPPQNLTSLPLIRIRFAEANFTCDPLDCRLSRPEADVNVTWADGEPGGVTLPGGQVTCASPDPVSSYCRLGELTRERGEAWVTTAASDVTE